MFYMSLLQQSYSDEISIRPNFSKADWPGLCNHLSTVNWLTVFTGCTTTEQYWEVFLHVVANSIDHFVPCYKITKHTTCACFIVSLCWAHVSAGLPAFVSCCFFSFFQQIDLI